MSGATGMSEKEAKERLDKLIAKARHCLYKPIQIAEILYRHRTERYIDLSNLESYRRVSNTWKADVAVRLLGRKPSLNSRYEDQLFDDAVMPPRILSTLGKINTTPDTPGIIEVYIYDRVGGNCLLIAEMARRLESLNPREFKWLSFIQYFEMEPRLRRSVDKVYETSVYALFDTLTKYLKATVSLSVSRDRLEILRDYEKFAKIVLGIDTHNLTISQPARLFRLGVTNAADARIDMWANFGPAVQVKHITLDPTTAINIATELRADKIVVVCKKVERQVIDAVMRQVGLDNRIRGFITEADLTAWYDLSMSTKYAATIGKDVLSALLKEFTFEFPLSKSSMIDAFFQERNYSREILKGIWART